MRIAIHPGQYRLSRRTVRLYIPSQSQTPATATAVLLSITILVKVFNLQEPIQSHILNLPGQILKAILNHPVRILIIQNRLIQVLPGAVIQDHQIPIAGHQLRHGPIPHLPGQAVEVRQDQGLQEEDGLPVEVGDN